MDVGRVPAPWCKSQTARKSGDTMTITANRRDVPGVDLTEP